MRGLKSMRLDLAVAAVVLMPFFTVGLGFRSSLVVQAVGILAVVTATLPELFTLKGLHRVKSSPRPVIFGVAAVAIATTGGGIMGLIRGHDPGQIVGQVLAMGLLPMAAVGGLAAWKEPIERRWKAGLLSAVTLGCLIQLVWGMVAIIILGEPSRLFLPNAVSVIGPALMGLCFAIVSTRDSERWMRRLAWAATVSILLVVLGSSLRSLWILTPVTVVGLAVFWRGVRSRETLIALLSVVLLGLGMMGSVWQMERWVGKNLPDVLQRTPCSLFPEAGGCFSGSLEFTPDTIRRRWFDTPVDLPASNAWRLVVRGRGEGQGAMVVTLLFFDESGRRIGKIPAPVRAGAGEVVIKAVGTVDREWAEVGLRLARWEGSSGHWQLDGIECAPLDSPLLARLAGKALAVKERVLALMRAAVAGRPEGDATLGFRWHESIKIIEELCEGSWVDLLAGRGLGATIRLDIDGFDNRGNWIYYDEVNYIHNWYLFLLFKLGIVGFFLVLGAVAGWILWIGRKAGRSGDPEIRAFLVAAAGAWIVYSIWSLTSPEILDFRMAPLWGWLLAAAAGAKGNRGSTR